MKRERKCPSGKKKYRTLEQAHSAINRIMELVASGEDRNCEQLRSYRCGMCSNWHLSSKTKEEQRDWRHEQVSIQDVNSRLSKLENKNRRKMKKVNWFNPVDDDSKRLIIHLHNQGDVSYLEIARTGGWNPEEVKQVIVEHSKYFK